ncbi:MAG TPA: tautomerase family protein [Solirubrobacterales bacterium]|jgi:phenylpyruvate tautomerase PptA (4-oxalocrotonate tautomerase family)
MPHLTVNAFESDLQGREADLIASLTDAVAGIYGEWARAQVVVLLNGFPAGRWGVGGTVAESAAPIVELGIREEAFARPDAAELAPAIIAAVTEAIVSVLGEQARDGLLVELIGTPAARTGLGGVPATQAG